jgi:hypothetical protein
LFALARLTGHLQQLGVSVERVAEVLDLPVAAATAERSVPRAVHDPTENSQAEDEPEPRTGRSRSTSAGPE